MGVMLRVYATILLVLACQLMRCHGNSDCIWSWGDWSACIPADHEMQTNTRERARILHQLPDLGKGLCPSDVTQQQQCTANVTAHAPSYCSQPDMKLCDNGYCLSSDLWCNSDDDCLDDSDERNCTQLNKYCNFTSRKLPVHTTWSRGIDHVMGQFRGHVMQEGFAGECERKWDAEGQAYRMPWNVMTYATPSVVVVNTRLLDTWKSFIDHVTHKFPFPMMLSRIISTFRSKADSSLFVEATLSATKETIELKQGDLRPHNDLLRDLHRLPATFLYKPYTEFVRKFGTHFSRSVHVGGEISVILSFEVCKFYDRQTEIRSKLHKSLEGDHLMSAIASEASYAMVIVNGGLLLESPGGGAVIETVDNAISRIVREQGQRFIHHDRRGVEEDKIYRLLESSYVKDVANIEEVKRNLIRATHDYISRFDKSLCNHCRNEAVVVHDNVTSQDGCLCFDSRTVYNLKLCSVTVDDNRTVVLPIVMILVCIIFLLFIVIIANYTKKSYRRPRIKKHFAPVCSRGGLKDARGLFCLPDGHILLTDSHHVYRFNPVGEEGSSTRNHGITLSTPRGLTYHVPSKSVIVCESGGQCLTYLNAHLDVLKRRRQLPGNPIDVTTLDNGHLVVIMETNDPQTRFVEMLSADPTEGAIVRWSNDALVMPSFLAVGFSNIVLSDSSTGQVLKFTPNGMKYEDFNIALGAPRGICCLPDGRHLVCCTENYEDRIVLIDADGNRLDVRVKFHRKDEYGSLENITCSETMGHVVILFRNHMLVYKTDDFISALEPSQKGPTNPRFEPDV